MRVTCRQYRSLVALDKAVRAKGRPEPIVWSVAMRELEPVWRDVDGARAALKRLVDGGLVVHEALGYRLSIAGRELLEREHACQTCRPLVAA